MKFSIPIRVRSSQNLREHFMAKAKRVKAERRAVAQCWMVAYSILKLREERLPELPLVVSLTRVGPKLWDSDNNVSGMKGVRDQIAEQLGVDDGDQRIKWIYGQRQAKGWAVEVGIVKLEHPVAQPGAAA